jgi:protein TonB
MTLLRWPNRTPVNLPAIDEPANEQPETAATTAWARLRARWGDRALGIVLTLLLELALIGILLTLGMTRREAPPVFSSLTTVDVGEQTENPDATEEDETEPQPDSQAEVAPVAPPLPSALPPLPSPVTTPAPVPPPQPDPQPTPQPSATRSPPRAVIRPGGGTYGPPGSAARREGDSQVVGTAPDGSPLYAARWFREPTDAELGPALATVDPPAWALIACKTAPNWAVTDCVGIEQSPTSSNMMNAVLATAWRFQVRPPRRGNASLMGAWVRIRISYTRGRAGAG